MRCSELIDVLEELAPVSYACDWDNPGLLAGRMGKEVHKVLLALDATDEVVKQAVREQADMLITHHPLIFKPLKHVNDQDFIGRRLMALIQNDISCYAMHTNFDAAPGGMAALAADLLGLSDTQVMEPTATDGELTVGIGLAGKLPRQMMLKELAGRVKEAFGLPFVTVYGLNEFTEPIKLAAVSPGSGGSMVKWGRKSGAQVLITGDIGHHDGLDAVAAGMAVIDAGHYGTEYIFTEFIERYLKENIEERLEYVQAPRHFPAEVL